MKRKVPDQISQKYRLPKRLTDFQLSLYIHLIEWKWKHITTQPGKNGNLFYDAILPKQFKADLHPLYRPLVQEIRQDHLFKLHKHFGHMASSQAACINLFAPILRHAQIADSVMPAINPRFSKLATDRLEGGFKFEYWDESNPLNDHTDAAGTDSDVAIAYYDTNGDLSLWLIEHKLTEDEFTTCGGYRSSRNKAKALCKKGSDIINDKTKCYYQYKCKYRYWDITHRSGLFDLHAERLSAYCPFIGGENQLWRNQIMAHAIQKQNIYKYVHFSVVHHPGNDDLQQTIDRYVNLLSEKDRFSVFNSRQLIDAAYKSDNREIVDWADWYSDLYHI